MWLLDELAESRIRDAIQRGELDNLPGAGAPLHIEDDRMVPEALRVAYRVLKNAGYVPREVGLLREIREVEDLMANADEGQRSEVWARRLALLRARLQTHRGETSLLVQHGVYAQRVRERLASEPGRR